MWGSSLKSPVPLTRASVESSFCGCPRPLFGSGRMKFKAFDLDFVTQMLNYILGLSNTFAKIINTKYVTNNIRAISE
jgi:hypothetical protein